MALSARVGLVRPGFELDIELEAEAGEVVALAGPNGAGKTSFLRVVAGLERAAAGRVVLDGRVLMDAGAGVHLPAAERRVGMVFQDHLLFPHMTVDQNVRFGAADEAAAAEWLERLELGALRRRRPRELSGGESQRVALARTLAARPRLLLLDEPLASLDVESRNQVRRQLARRLPEIGIPVILVTHDPVDAGALARRLLVVEGGHITQGGSLAEVTGRPQSDWAARLGGVNLYRGEGRGNRVQVEGGGSIVVAEPVTGGVLVAVPPRAVSLYRQPPGGSPRNSWEGRVQGVEHHGNRVRVSVRAELPIVAEITPQAAVALGIEPGAPVWVSVKASEVAAYPA